MSQLPIFAPLKSSQNIMPSLLSCVQGLENFGTEDLITHNNNGLSIHDPDGKFSEFLKIESATYRHQNNSGQIYTATKSSFKSLNLTYLPDFPDSLQQQFFVDLDGLKKSYLFVPNENWQWRSDLALEPLKDFVASVGLKQVHLVRLIFLNPPAVGGVHVDTSEKSMSNYYNYREGVSLTYNLQAGDASLYYRFQNKIYQIDPQLQSWHFNPSYPHAIGEVHKPRIQLRIFGRLNSNDYLQRLDLNNAVWGL